MYNRAHLSAAKNCGENIGYATIKFLRSVFRRITAVTILIVGGAAALITGFVLGLIRLEDK